MVANWASIADRMSLDPQKDPPFVKMVPLTRDDHLSLLAVERAVSAIFDHLKSTPQRNISSIVYRSEQTRSLGKCNGSKTKLACWA